MTRPGSPLDHATWGHAGRFRRPLYGSSCFAHLPATIKRLLLDTAEGPVVPLDTPGPYETVILLFIDAFGWQFFQRFADGFPFLARFRDQGQAVPITAQFPSTTAGHVTCIHTGVPVAQSGIFEWFLYEPLAGAVIAPLPFCYAGDKQRDTLKQDGLTAADIFPPDTFYQDLAGHGVASFIFQHSSYTPSTYSDYAFRGAELVSSFDTFAEGLTNLAWHLRQPAHGHKRYFFLYADAIDHVGHDYGPDTEQFAAEIDATFTLLERLFYQKVAGKVSHALLLMTADHGQVPVDPKTTVYINELPELIDLPQHLRLRGRDGQPIKFAGSCRDLFLYVRDESLAEMQDRLQRALAGKAEVWKVDDLVQDGLFGQDVGSRLRERLGNLVILPYEGESVYWREPQRFEQHFRGHHGGLTPAEMDTGVYLLPL